MALDSICRIRSALGWISLVVNPRRLSAHRCRMDLACTSDGPRVYPTSYSVCINAGYTDHGYHAHSGTSYWGCGHGPQLHELCRLCGDSQWCGAAVVPSRRRLAVDTAWRAVWRVRRRPTVSDQSIWRVYSSKVTRTSLAGLRGVGYARLSSSTGMVRTPAVWRAYSAKPGWCRACSA